MTKNYFYNIKEIYKLVTNVVLGYSSLKLINDRCESVCMSGTQKSIILSNLLEIPIILDF